jgi:hypothetical protein
MKECKRVVTITSITTIITTTITNNFITTITITIIIYVTITINNLVPSPLSATASPRQSIITSTTNIATITPQYQNIDIPIYP